MMQKLAGMAESAAHRVRLALSEVLDDPQWDRRTDRRIPYFGPVSVALPFALEVNLSAFARDISPGGIGLVHLMPLEPAEAVVKLTLPSGDEVALRIEILWCRDYGNGWYASGGRIQDVVGEIKN